MTKILLVGPAWVGDMVMSQTLLKFLKKRDPHVSLTMLAPDWTFSLLSRMPEIDQAIKMPFAHGELNLRKRWRLAQQLRAEHYDQAIILPNSFKSGLIPWFAGIKKRTGYRREGRSLILNDARTLQKKHGLMVEQFLALGLAPEENLPKAYDYPCFSVPETISPARPILALAPGAAFGSAKRWPVSYFAQVAQEKLAQDWEVWLFGSKDDQSITKEIMQLTQQRCHDFAGQLDLSQTIDRLAQTTGLISNDSGLMHIAAALQKPLIALYGPTSPQFTPPLSAKATILKLELPCQPCFKRTCPLEHQQCLRMITPIRVLDAIKAWAAT